MTRIFVWSALAITVVSSAFGATVDGRVGFVTKRGQNPVVSETLVWLDPASTSSSRPVRRAPATFRMFTRGKMLLPHVMVIPAGSTVEFPNDDPISHNLFSLASNNAFDLGLYRRGAGKSHKFDGPGTVSVYCNVHPNMSAVIHVMSTPYFAFADNTGAFHLTEVPTGKYRLTVWNEQGGQTALAVDVPASGFAVPPITLDSRNYRDASHTNKMGKAYGPSSSREY